MPAAAAGGPPSPRNDGRLWVGPMLIDGEFRAGWLDTATGERGRGAPEGVAPGGVRRGLIIPALRNCHTHLGDTLARRALPARLPLTEAVGPGGWKQRWLAAHDARASVAAGLAEATRSGTGRLLDFREGGAAGLAALEGHGFPGTVTGLGRAAPGEPLPGPHLGLSSYHDLPSGEPERLAAAAHARCGLVALHHAEAVHEPLDPVLALRPDFLVHLCTAERGDLERVRDAKVAVVACPRANRRFGLRPPLAELARLGIDVGLGTDNGMLATADLLAELRYCRRAFPTITPRTLVGWAVGGLRQAFNKVAVCRPDHEGHGKWVLLSRHHCEPWKALFHPRTRALAFDG